MRTRSLPLIVLFALSPVLAQAETPGVTPVKAPLTNAQRQQIAIDHVKKTIEEDWVPTNQSLDVRSAIIPFGGNPRNPITGDGPITLYAKQRLKTGGPIAKAVHGFSKYANRKFDVNVCANGEACILDEQSLAPQYRVGRAIARAIPAGQITNDLISSGKASEMVAWLSTAATSGGGTIMHGGTFGLPELAAAAFAGGTLVKGFNAVTSAVAKQRTMRDQSLTETVKWIHDTKAAEGEWPILRQAYDHYSLGLEKLSPGAKPVSISDFAHQLAANNL